MPTDAILSIKPQFAEAIFRGEKKFEFRRKIFQTKKPGKIFVYASAPISKVIGHFELGSIISETPTALWQSTKRGAGITKDYFFQYFDGCSEAHALKVRKAVRYSKPLSLSDNFGFERPPQSFCYVDSPPVAPE